MKKRKFSVIIGVFIALMMVTTIVLAACPPANNDVPIQSITLTAPSEPLDIVLGNLPQAAQRTVAYTRYPENASGTVAFNSSNETIATVLPNGVVNVHTAGTAYIYATSGDVVSTNRIQVNVSHPEVNQLTLSSTVPNFPYVSFLYSDIEEAQSPTTFNVTATVNPPQVGNRGVSWTSENPSVATINHTTTAHPNTITVTVVGRGITTITATSIGNEEFTQSFTIEVTGQRWLSISTADDWNLIEEYLGNRTIAFYLANDIDFEGRTIQVIGREPGPENHTRGATATSWAFNSILDGRGHTLSNFYIERNGAYTGLFHKAYGATFKNFTVENATVLHQTTNTPSGQNRDYWPVMSGVWVGHGTFTMENVAFLDVVDTTVVTGSWWNFAGGIAGRVQTGSRLENIIVDINSPNAEQFASITATSGPSSTFNNIFVSRTEPFSGIGGDEFMDRMFGFETYRGILESELDNVVDTLDMNNPSDTDFSVLDNNAMWNTSTGLPSLIATPFSRDVSITASNRYDFTFIGELETLDNINYDFFIVLNPAFSGPPSVVVRRGSDTETFVGVASIMGYKISVPYSFHQGEALEIYTVTPAGQTHVRVMSTQTTEGVSIISVPFTQIGQPFTFTVRAHGRLEGTPTVHFSYNGGTFVTTAANVVPSADTLNDFIVTIPANLVPTSGNLVITDVVGFSVAPSAAITSVAEFNAIANCHVMLARPFHLEGNINFSGEDLVQIGGTGLDSIGTFTGTFDGRGFALQNFTLASADFYNGIFRNTVGATIKNLTIDNGALPASYQGNGGLLIGRSFNTVVENVKIVNSTVAPGTAAQVWYSNAALIGIANAGTVLNNVVIDVTGATAAFVNVNNGLTAYNVFITYRGEAVPTLINDGIDIVDGVFFVNVTGTGGDMVVNGVRVETGTDPVVVTHNRVAFGYLPTWAWTVGASGLPTLVQNPTMP